MARYDPTQPLWKRNVAGILDFVLAFAVFAVLTAEVFGAGKAPAFIARNPNTKYVTLSGYAFAATVALTVGYFVVLGATGGTVFQRLFGMKRAKAGDDIQEIIKTIVRSDGKRRVQIYRREDGLFSFVEEQRLGDRTASRGGGHFRLLQRGAIPQRPANSKPAQQSAGWV
jgi:hypothetical protein